GITAPSPTTAPLAWPGGTVGIAQFVRRPCADSRFAGARRLHRPASRLPDAERHLRILARARRALRQGAVPRAGLPGSRGAIALARLSAWARDGNGVGRRHAAPLR